jgi:hypothetical protein
MTTGCTACASLGSNAYSPKPGAASCSTCAGSGVANAQGTDCNSAAPLPAMPCAACLPPAKLWC